MESAAAAPYSPSASNRRPARPAAAYALDPDDEEEALQSTARSGHSKRVPRYAVATTATTLPEYANAEAEAIRQSFSTGNYRAISHLPTELRSHYVSEATASRIEDNLTGAYFVAPHHTYRKFGTKDALFSTFDYQPDEYSLATQISRQERKQEEEKRWQVNPLPFLPSSHRPLPINQLAGVAPYEENSKFSEPYESTEEQARRMAFFDSQKILHGPFVPTQAARALAEPATKLKLPDIISELMRELDADWGDCSFQIYADEDDLIIVQFKEETIDNPKGLLAYMNLFVKTNKVVSQFALSKLVELWNHSAADGFLYYAFRPPFCRRRAEESFFTLHPEMSVPGGKFEQRKPEEKEQLRPDSAEAAAAAGSTQRLQHSSSGGPASSSSASASQFPSAPPAGAASSGVSSQERARVAQLMASFDAGLQIKNTESEANTNS